MFSRPLGIGGILVLLADVWAIVNIAQSNASPGRKAIWIVLVLVFPLGGFVLWLLLGPKTSRG